MRVSFDYHHKNNDIETVDSDDINTNKLYKNSEGTAKEIRDCTIELKDKFLQIAYGIIQQIQIIAEDASKRVVIQVSIPSPILNISEGGWKSNSQFEIICNIDETIRIKSVEEELHWWSGCLDPGCVNRAKFNYIEGNLDEWCYCLKSSGKDPKVRKIFATKNKIPLDKLEIFEAINLYNAFHLRLIAVPKGEYSVSGIERSNLFLVFVPVENVNGNDKKPKKLKLASLEDVEFEKGEVIGEWGPEKEERDYPIISFFPMFPQRHPKKICWNTVVSWGKVNTGLAKEKYLSFWQLFDKIWNPQVDLSRSGRRMISADMPWVPVPNLNSTDDTVTARPLLVFNDSLDGQMLIRKIIVHGKGPGANQEGRAVGGTYEWQGEPVPSLPSTSNFMHLIEGKIDIPEEKIDIPKDMIWEWEKKYPDSGYKPAFSDKFLKYLAPLSMTEELDEVGEQLDIRWSISEFKTSTSDWKDIYNIGSIDIKLDESVSEIGTINSDQEEETDKEISLSCVIRGTWTKDKCHLFLETKLEHLPIEARLSSSTDSATKYAVIDSVGAEEESLHTSSPPILSTLGTGHWTKGKLELHTRSDIGHNQTVRIKIDSKSGKTTEVEDGRSYVQFKPFVFAKINNLDRDPEGGSNFAIWTNDNLDGPGWRMPYRSLTFSFPPQAVGEEMERGIRFWKKTGADYSPYIDETEPVRFRFSSSTSITVLPESGRRRYNPVANNLERILVGAHVDKFSTELVYPIRVTFERTIDPQKDVRISETGNFLGRPTENLPPYTKLRESEIIEDVIADGLGTWASNHEPSDGKDEFFVFPYQALRLRHSASRANFAARMARFHLYDQKRGDLGLYLSKGLRYKIRSTNEGAPPLINPLPQNVRGKGDDWQESPVDVGQEKKSIPPFTNFLKAGAWVDEDADGENLDGAFRGGIIHTFEFPSELLAVLGTPSSETGSIENLSFSTLGATGGMSVSFDEGRTTFKAEVVDGQLSRLLKVRIGRVGVLWNKAKHIIVYERTVIPSAQFDSQQKDFPKIGWPILRKTEEYIEPVEKIRKFESEKSKDQNRTGFLDSAEIVTPRIYVDGAWGRDLGHGYEIPLWNKGEDPANNDNVNDAWVYPRPQLCLWGVASKGAVNRLWLQNPDELYFYTNTERGAGDNPDKWAAQPGVDLPKKTFRMGVVTKQPSTGEWDDFMSKSSSNSPNPNSLRKERFDLRVSSEGPVNLQENRGDKEMLASMEMVSIGRSDETSASTVPIPTNLQNMAKSASEIRNITGEIDAWINNLPHKILQYDCEQAADKLTTEFKEVIKNAKTTIKGYEVLGFDANSLKSTLENRLEKELLGRFALPDAQVIVLLNPISGYLRELQTQSDKYLKENKEAIQKATKTQFKEIVAVLESLRNTLKSELYVPATELKKDLVTIKISIEKVKDAINKVAFPNPQKAQLKQVKDSAKKARKLIQKSAGPKPQFRSTIQTLTTWLKEIERVASLSSENLDSFTVGLKNELLALAKRLTELTNQLDVLITKLTVKTPEEFFTAIFASVDNVERQIELLAGDNVETIRLAIDNILTQVNAENKQIEGILLTEYGKFKKGIDGLVKQEITNLINRLVDGAEKLVNWLNDTQSAFKDYWGNTLDTLETQTEKIITNLGEKVCEGIEEIQRVARKYERQIKEEISGEIEDILDEQTKAQFEKFGSSIAKAGKGLKLAKAIGELPALPNLTFNVDRAEYVFDDFKKQIETSAFVAKTKEIEAGLKDLGINVPSTEIFNQIIPKDLPIDFNKIMKGFGGLDFEDLFKKFRLPELRRDQFKITHGIDKATKSAWLKSEVDLNHSEEESLFEFAALAVNMSEMSFKAKNEMRQFLGGEKVTVTDAALRSDWELVFAGAKIASFRQVTIRYDGHKTEFDIDPSKIEYHPSIKFISDLSKTLEEEIPPAIQITKDERGIPTGARVCVSSVVPPLNFGAVSTGPMSVSSGVGLELKNKGEFKINAFAGVGSKQSPVFLQISWLGGGVWVECTATKAGPEVEYNASIGVALGSLQSINLAGVAKGQYAFLLFVYAEYSNISGGSIRAGISIRGSARILGMANAYVYLLLEASHSSEGGTTGRGLLEVEIEITWCYTLRINKQVTKEF